MFCCKHKLSFLTESNDALFDKSHARTKLLVNQMVKKRSFRFMKVVHFRIFFGWSTCCWAWHFATPPIGFPRNYVWESTTEIPTVYKCHCQDLDREFDLMNKFSSNRRHYPDMVCVTHQHYGIFVLVTRRSFLDRLSNVGFFLRAYLRAVVTCVFVMKNLKFVFFIDHNYCIFR